MPTGPTNLQANWADVAHGSIDLIRIDSVSIDLGGNIQGYAGDGDRFNSVAAVLMNDPTVTITSSDPAALMSISPGTDATLTATHKDAKLQAGGDIIYTIANCVAAGASTQGAHAAFGTASMTFKPYAPDGQTNPVSFTRA